MTAPADRCKICDRAECDEAEAGATYTRIMNDFQAGGSAYTQVQWSEALTRHAVAFEACRAHKVDWRGRCQAVEAEALASRALLEELLGARPAAAFAPAIEEGWQEVAARIRDHLRGRP